MIKFMVEYDITLDLNDVHLHAQRVNDATIMETVMSTTSHVPTIKSINRVRMKLKVLWLSDIVTADGRHIDRRFLKDGYNIIRNSHQWPLQHNVTTLDWQQWTRWVKGLCRNHAMTLMEPLGQWTLPTDQWKLSWDCLVTRDRQILYIRTDDGLFWKRHIRQNSRNRRAPRYYKEFLLHREIQEPTLALDRANYSSTTTYIELICASTNEQREASNCRAFYNTPFLPTKDNIMAKLQSIFHPEFLSASAQIDLLLRDFSNGSTVSVSDGSYYPESGKAAGAWVIESSCQSQWIMVAITVPGPKEHFTSYRSELTGLLGISITLRLLAACTSPPPHCIIGCDGKAALQALTVPKNAISANSNNADIVSIINDLWNSFVTSPIPVHIDGHQDTFQKKTKSVGTNERPNG